MNSPSSMQKNPNNRNPLNNMLLNSLNGIKQNSPTDLQRTNSSQSQQMLLLNNNPLQLTGNNNIQNMPSSIAPEMNQNLNSINNNLINNLNPINSGVQQISQVPVQPQILGSPLPQQPNNSNLNVMNYLTMNTMQNSLMNIPGINQIIGPQNYSNIHGQINNIPPNPMSNMSNNLQNSLNSQFNQPFNQGMLGLNPTSSQQNLVSPAPGQQQSPAPSKILTKQDNNSGNNRQQDKRSLNNLIGTIQGLLQDFQGVGDPRKKRK